MRRRGTGPLNIPEDSSSNADRATVIALPHGTEEQDLEQKAKEQEILPPVIHVDIAKKINYACHQSSYALVRSLSIENPEDGEDLTDLVLDISADQDVIKTKQWRIDLVTAGQTIYLSDRRVDLRGGFLAELSDRMTTDITFTLRQVSDEDADQQVDDEEEALAVLTVPVDVLAYNEWGGSNFMPELLPAFSMPNDPAIDKIMRKSAEILERSNENPALNGYEDRSRERVWKLTAAVYNAIASLNLAYAMPPASFERNGQKIRLPSDILEGRVATCLDTTMLFAACLEQIGLNPIIAMPEGHALIGVWLQPEQLSSIVIDDAEILRKRVQLKEMVLIETTYLSQSPPPPFSMAVMRANEQLTEDLDESFNVAIDVCRARDHRITPLGLRIKRAAGEDEDNETIVELPVEEAPDLPDFDVEVEEEVPDTPETRLDHWQTKLLDLSGRNPLLNYRASASSLTLVCPDPGELEDRLSDGTKMSIVPTPDAQADGQDEELHKQRTGESIAEEYAREALRRKQILVQLPKEQLEKRAIEIYRKGQTALQEGGSNTLYLALGFLHWKRDDKQKKRSRAPLILLPVTLERASIRSGLKLSGHDDEPRFNTTLIEMLRRDFEIDLHALDGALPEDDHGVDVAGVWDTVRRAVKDSPGFEVVEDVVLGHFSFAKYLMWKDLRDRSDQLKRSKLVRHLMETPNDPYESQIDFVDAAEIDGYEPSDLLTPLPADASQMSAIATADRGKDFVIIGPPGTGKSQTISNLIAHLLGTGKTVLFVSEKMAALNVVHRRLEDIGVGKFCLELHSNKAKKKDVLARLGQSWAASTILSSHQWTEQADRLKRYRDRLNGVVDALHSKRNNGLTAYYAIGISIRDRDIANRIAFYWPSVDEHNEVEFNRLHDVIENLAVQAEAVGDFQDTPFDMVDSGDWSPQWEIALIGTAEKLALAARQLREDHAALVDAIKITGLGEDEEALEALRAFLPALLDCYRRKVGFALDPKALDVIETANKATAALKNYKSKEETLSCSYRPLSWKEIDGNSLANAWNEAQSKWFVGAYFARKRIIKDLQQKGALGKPNPCADASTFTELKRIGTEIEKYASQLEGLREWAGFDTDILDLVDITEAATKLRSGISGLSDDIDSLVAIRVGIRRIVEEGNELLGPDGVIRRVTDRYMHAMEFHDKAALDFRSAGGHNPSHYDAEEGSPLLSLAESMDSLVERRVELNNWCAWRRRRNEAFDVDLRPLVEGIETGAVPVDGIEETFLAAYCAWFSAQVITEDEILRTFNRAEHQGAIEAFREADDKFREATAKHIVAKLSGQLPGPDNIKKKSEWGVLQRELQKRQRHKPIRRLVEEIPDAFTKLAPCLMMSPLSVAQYLPPDQSLFDVVIFDEASQITVWDAVGAIARGKQMIIAGDPKQMPPTSFFARADTDTDDDAAFEPDLESILDEMLGASIPQCVLNLHYRSRRESLIAFSNDRYYDNSLTTFPAPEHPDNGVKLRRVENGVYARGKGRHNIGEADAIVEEIVQRLSAAAEAGEEQSIGVVTFNSEQQTLILNKLDDARRRHPEIDPFFSDVLQEPVFVKNLESVQGDERDVILFSITYGPDLSGHVTMNFGPLNRQGGERRLNVAMTRARHEMIVFSTIRAEQIDLNRTNAEAVRDLKNFLEFAERGHTALAGFDQGSLGGFDSPFESAVARELKRKGWVLRTQVGVSAFRIDLGIVHPDHSGAYLAGIECDGAMYHSSAYARERDKIREAVLRGLGWEIFRVWSTDWWIDQAGALQRLHEALEAHLVADRERRRREEEGDEEDGGLSALMLNYDGDDDNVKEEGALQQLEEPSRPERPVIDLDPEDYQDIEDDPEEDDEELPPSASSSLGSSPLQDEFLSGIRKSVSKEEPTETTPSPTNRIDATAEDVGDDDYDLDYHYHYVDIVQLKKNADPSRFYNDDYGQVIKKMLYDVIDEEGPIHEDVLVRRLARAHDFQRAGNQIRDRVLGIAQRARGSTVEDVGRFFWQKGTVKERVTQIRADGRDVEMRNVNHICREELQMIAESFQIEDAAELGYRLGIQRLKAPTLARLQRVLDDYEAALDLD